MYGVGRSLERGEFAVSKLEGEVVEDTEVQADEVEVIFKGFRGSLGDCWFSCGPLRFWEAAHAFMLLTVNKQDLENWKEEKKE